MGCNGKGLGKESPNQDKIVFKPIIKNRWKNKV